MSTILFIILLLLLWFIWRQLQMIADELCRLRRIAEERNERPTYGC